MGIKVSHNVKPGFKLILHPRQMEDVNGSMQSVSDPYWDVDGLDWTVTVTYTGSDAREVMGGRVGDLLEAGLSREELRAHPFVIGVGKEEEQGELVLGIHEVKGEMDIKVAWGSTASRAAEDRVEVTMVPVDWGVWVRS